MYIMCSVFHINGTGRISWTIENSKKKEVLINGSQMVSVDR